MSDLRFHTCGRSIVGQWPVQTNNPHGTKAKTKKSKLTRIKVDGTHKRNVHAQASVRPRAFEATKCPNGPAACGCPRWRNDQTRPPGLPFGTVAAHLIFRLVHEHLEALLHLLLVRHDGNLAKPQGARRRGRRWWWWWQCAGAAAPVGEVMCLPSTKSSATLPARPPSTNSCRTAADTCCPALPMTTAGDLQGSCTHARSIRSKAAAKPGLRDLVRSCRVLALLLSQTDDSPHGRGAALAIVLDALTPPRIEED